MARSTVTLLTLFTILVLSLVGCGSAGGGGGGATSAGTAVGDTTSVGATTSGGGGKEGTAPAEMTSSTVGLAPVNPDTSGTASLTTGASGTATLTNTDGGEVEVGLRLQNLEDLPDAEHPADIHQGGTCADVQAGDDSAPVLYSLDSVFTAANHAGSSRTRIPGVSVAELLSGTAKYINVHDEQHGNETPPSIACADLSSSSSGGSAIGATRQD